MKIKNKELLNLDGALKSVGNLEGVRFAYAVSRNIARLKPEIESLHSSIKPSEEFNNFDKARVELAEKHADKDEAGKPVIIKGKNGEEYEIKDKKKFEKELEALKKEHKVAIDGRDKQIEDFNKMLEDEIEFDAYTIKIEDVPKNITPQQMTGILGIIEDNK